MLRISMISRLVVTLAVALVVTVVITPMDAAARQAGAGEAHVVNWPQVIYEAQGAMDVPSMRAAEQYGDVDVLPKVDTLSLRYAWSVVYDEPHIDFDLSWVQGSGGILDGRVVRAGRITRDIVLDLVELHADVVVRGERVGDMVLALDSLGLLPSPDAYSFQTWGVTWSDVFATVDSASARRAFEKGFTLENLDILRAGFEDIPESEGRDVPVEVRRRPVRRTIFVPDTDIWIGWNLGPDPYLPPPRSGRRTWAPRGETSGRRGSSTRGGATRGGTRDARPSGRRGDGIDLPIGKKDSDDDDDDDSQLLGPALGVAAAVGIFAVAGGTIGIQGSGDSPIGLFSGAVRPRWAFLLHGSINPEVARRDNGEKLRVGMLWGIRPVAGGLRPAFGAGVLFTELGDDIDMRPTIDLGLIFSQKQVVFIATVDAWSGTPRFGIGANLRSGE